MKTHFREDKTEGEQARKKLFNPLATEETHSKITMIIKNSHKTKCGQR